MLEDWGIRGDETRAVDVSASSRSDARRWSAATGKFKRIATGLVGICAALALLCVCAQPANAQDEQQSTLERIQHLIVVGPSGPLLPPILPHFHLTGYILSNDGFFVNSHQMRTNRYFFPGAVNPITHVPNYGVTVPYFVSHNSIATLRQQLQVDLNWDINENNHLYARFWGVYEPAYPVEYVGRQNFDTDFYNQYNLHEWWWKSRHGPLTLFMGQQIVTWGESLAFRVGDVINPQDTAWAFGFANLEQSRKALYMLHPILNLPSWGPFSSNFAELIVVPALQPQYTSVSGAQHGAWGVSHDDIAGGFNTGAPASPPQQTSFSAANNWSTPDPSLMTMGRFQPRFYPYQFGLGCPEAARAASACVHPFTNPAVNAMKGYNVTLGLWHMPLDTWSSTKVGFRLHTLWGENEMTFLYYYGHQDGPNWYNIGHAPNPTSFTGIFPQINRVGLTWNRPLYGLPGVLSSIPLVARAEGVIRDRAPFNVTSPYIQSGLAYSPTLTTLLALDVDNYYAPWASATGPLSMHLEWYNQCILDYRNDMTPVFVTGGHVRKNTSSILFNIGDSWWWNVFNFAWISVYTPDHNIWLMFPTLTLTPPWTDKYFFGIKWIEILGNNGLAMPLKGKQQILGTFQYNFNLM